MFHARRPTFTLLKYPILLFYILVHSNTMCFAQHPTGGGRGSQQGVGNTSVTLVINVRDFSGVPMDGSSIVKLAASVGSYNRTVTTRDASTAVFEGIPQGEYEAEASYPGYQTANERISVTAVGATQQVYIYMIPQSDKNPQDHGPKASSCPQNSSRRSTKGWRRCGNANSKLRALILQRDLEWPRAIPTSVISWAPRNSD